MYDQCAYDITMENFKLQTMEDIKNSIVSSVHTSVQSHDPINHSQQVYPMSPPMGHRCTECGVNMGPNNPRQLCGKTRCVNKIFDDDYEDCPLTPVRCDTPRPLPPAPRKRKRASKPTLTNSVRVKSMEDIPSSVKTAFRLFEFNKEKQRRFVGFVYFEGYDDMTEKQQDKIDKYRECYYFFKKPCGPYLACSCNKSVLLLKMEN